MARLAGSKLVASFLHTCTDSQTPHLKHLEPLPGLHGPSPLLRLAPVRAPPFNFLVPPQACSKTDIDTRRRTKPKALGHLDEIQLMHVEHGAQAVRGVGLEIGSVAVFCGFVEVVVLCDEGFELGLDVWFELLV